MTNHTSNCETEKCKWHTLTEAIAFLQKKIDEEGDLKCVGVEFIKDHLMIIIEREKV